MGMASMALARLDKMSLWDSNTIRVLPAMTKEQVLREVVKYAEYRLEGLDLDDALGMLNGITDENRGYAWYCTIKVKEGLGLCKESEKRNIFMTDISDLFDIANRVSKVDRLTISRYLGRLKDIYGYLEHIGLEGGYYLMLLYVEWCLWFSAGELMQDSVRSDLDWLYFDKYGWKGFTE